MLHFMLSGRHRRLGTFKVVMPCLLLTDCVHLFQALLQVYLMVTKTTVVLPHGIHEPDAFSKAWTQQNSAALCAGFGECRPSMQL